MRSVSFGGSTSRFGGLLDRDGEQHLWMDLAADIEAPGDRKRNVHVPAGLLLAGIEGEGGGADVDVVEEFVRIAEADDVAVLDGDLVDGEGAPDLADDGRCGRPGE